MTALFFIVAFLAFVMSAAAGMGGSLILVPLLALMFGAKPGIALAALLLAGNNVCKLVAYRESLPVRASALLVAMTVLGAVLGANLLMAAPKWAVDVGVALVVVGAFWFELAQRRRTTGAVASPGPALQRTAPLLALLAGATSGFSGTSGPLKGIAIRGCGFDRFHLVGAASLVSLWGDATKAAVFFREGFYTSHALMWVGAALPLMLLGTWLGRRLNREMGEQLYAVTFWTVMTGYCVRLAFV